MSGFGLGLLAGVLVAAVGWISVRLWTTRHHHWWIVVAVIGGSMSPGLFANRGLLDRCRCGRMRWRPNVPLPAWWPADVLMPNEPNHTKLAGFEDVEMWLHGLPRWGQRAERRLVRQEVALAEERAAERKRLRHDRSGMGVQ